MKSIFYIKNKKVLQDPMKILISYFQDYLIIKKLNIVWILSEAATKEVLC